jgi:hypothetical protein
MREIAERVLAQFDLAVTAYENGHDAVAAAITDSIVRDTPFLARAYLEAEKAMRLVIDGAINMAEQSETLNPEWVIEQLDAALVEHEPVTPKETE